MEIHQPRSFSSFVTRKNSAYLSSSVLKIKIKQLIYFLDMPFTVV